MQMSDACRQTDGVMHAVCDQRGKSLFWSPFTYSMQETDTAAAHGGKPWCEAMLCCVQANGNFLSESCRVLVGGIIVTYTCNDE